MPVSAGSRLGPYEILTRLGAGGMGEVWRGRDTRLGRSVAIKVLPADLASDGDRLRRFEREARAASSLSHPNIVTVYEIERIGSAPVIVMELVEGRTLRELTADGPLPLRRILSIAPQIAGGLARAHASGIVHRDLKPENVMVTADGLVKILDFGLAKLTRPEEETGQTIPGSTVSAATRPGIAMGTVGYMSPEQASGHPVDYRSDQFSLGSILYEMAAGKPAFQRSTTPQTLAAIIEDEPEPIGAAAPKTPAPLRWVIARCLSKDAKGRYASTEDLARELTDLRDHISDLSSGSRLAIEPPRPRPGWRVPLLAGLTLLVGVALGLIASRRPETELPRYQRLTFRRGAINGARFTPDGQTIIYAANWEGKPMRLFSTRTDSAESTALQLPSARMLSISSSGMMAIGLQEGPEIPWGGPQTLAEAALTGGAPREILEDASDADWSPNGRMLVVIRPAGSGSRLEYPIGKVLHEIPTGFLLFPRFSPDGGSIAFVESIPRDFEVQSIVLQDLAGKRTTLTRGWGYTFGMAWNRRTREIWFTSREVDKGIGPLALHAVSTSGRHRLVARGPDSLVVQDISREGRVLLYRADFSQTTLFRSPGAKEDVDLTWHAFSPLSDLSDDGKRIVFCDQGFGGAAGELYLRATDGSPAVRLGAGADAGLSPDGKWVVSIPSTRNRLTLLPTGPGQSRVLPGHGMAYDVARYFPDGKRLLLSASAEGRPSRLWVQDVAGGEPRPLTPEGYSFGPISPDGKWVATRAPGGGAVLYPAEGGQPRPVPAITPEDSILRWDASGSGLFLATGAIPVRVDRLDISTGARRFWDEIRLADPAGVPGIDVRMTPDGKSYAYWYLRELDALYLVDGLK